MKTRGPNRLLLSVTVAVLISFTVQATFGSVAGGERDAYVSTTDSAEVRGQSQGHQTSNAEEHSPVAEPDLADIIPLASKLSGRLVALENGIAGLLDVSAIEIRYAGI